MHRLRTYTNNNDYETNHIIMRNITNLMICNDAWYFWYALAPSLSDHNDLWKVNRIQAALLIILIDNNWSFFPHTLPTTYMIKILLILLYEVIITFPSDM